MVRDACGLVPGGATAPPARCEPTALERLGWDSFFAQQLDAQALNQTPPVRVVAVHRSGLQVAGDGIDQTIPTGPEATAGDWLLFDPARPRSSRVLERKSLIKRRTPGTDRQIQLIAANIDTVFVVTSCNQDFNVARLERYLAICLEAGIEPVIVLTKSDLVGDPEPWIDRAKAVCDRVPVLALDARGTAPTQALGAWCLPGRTVAFLGSSGVGKSTLTNALLGATAIATQGSRFTATSEPSGVIRATGMARNSSGSCCLIQSWENRRSRWVERKRQPCGNHVATNNPRSNKAHPVRVG